jgi:hypothetical protein
MKNPIISPSEVDVFVNKVLDKNGSDFEPEIIPVIIESFSKTLNCFIDVEEKVKRDGGKVHYGWAIFKSDILCEAERHAVWENEDEELIDITPREFNFEQIMFVSDNDFIYQGQLVDNIRVNLTQNPIVDDFIFVCENLEILYTFGKRIDDDRMIIPPSIVPLIEKYESIKSTLLFFINSGGKPSSKCFCGGQKNYKNCHGLNLKQNISLEMSSIVKPKAP